MPQIRRFCKGFWNISDQKYELVVGSNINDPDTENIFAVGRIISPRESEWFYLDVRDIRTILKEHDRKLWLPDYPERNVVQGHDKKVGK